MSDKIVWATRHSSPTCAGTTSLRCCSMKIGITMGSRYVNSRV